VPGGARANESHGNALIRAGAARPQAGSPAPTMGRREELTQRWSHLERGAGGSGAEEREPHPLAQLLAHHLVEDRAEHDPLALREDLDELP